MSEQTVWGIHGGRTGDADSIFLKKNVVALGWVALGDLSGLSPDRDAFKTAVAKKYPDKKPGAIPNNAGQLFRFVHEMKVGDVICYPSQRDKHVHIGTVEREYRYDPKLGEADAEGGYPNIREVTWKASAPRTLFSQGALYEIGSAMSFFQIRNYADEFLAVLGGAPVSPPPLMTRRASQLPKSSSRRGTSC